MAFDDDDRPVLPDGLGIRRRRRSRGWSRRDLVEAIGRATERAGGRAESVAPALIRSIEECNEPVPYSLLALLAAGLDCNPVELLGPERPWPDDEDRPRGPLH